MVKSGNKISALTKAVKNFLQLPATRRLEYYLLFLALLVRIVYVLNVDASFALDPGDQKIYDSIAQSWLNSGAFMEGSSYRPPLYPLFLGSIYFVFGHKLLLVKLLQAVLGTISCVLTMAISKRMFSRTTTLLAGAIVAFTPVLIHYTAQVLSETLFTTLLLLILFLLVSRAEALRYKDMLLIGVLIGAASLCRTNIALFPFAIFVWLKVMMKYSWKRTFSLTAFAICAAAIIIAPWTIRNYHVHNHFVLISTNGGINLWIGNNPHATGDWLTPREYYSPEGLTEYEIDKEYYREALQFIVQNPGTAVTLGVKKLKIFYSSYPHVFDQIPFYTVLLCAITGIFLTLRNPRSSLLLLTVLYFSVLSCFFFANQRFHIPIIALLAIYAAYGFIKIEQATAFIFTIGFKLMNRGKVLHNGKGRIRSTLHSCAKEKTV